MTQLPGLAGDIENVIGLELTAKLLKAHGGLEITVPVRAKGSALAGVIGIHACEAIIKEIGPGRLMLPCAGFRGRDAIRLERKARALDMLRDGASLSTVARECDLSLRVVSNYRAEIKDERQQELPF